MLEPPQWTHGCGVYSELLASDLRPSPAAKWRKLISEGWNTWRTGKSGASPFASTLSSPGPTEATSSLPSTRPRISLAAKTWCLVLNLSSGGGSLSRLCRAHTSKDATSHAKRRHTTKSQGHVFIVFQIIQFIWWTEKFLMNHLKSPNRTLNRSFSNNDGWTSAWINRSY